MTTKDTRPTGLTRRDLLRSSGVALGGLAIGSTLAGCSSGNASEQCDHAPCYPTDPDKMQRYSYFDSLDAITPWTPNAAGGISGTPLLPNEMRITFMGSTIPPVRKAQQEMSIFVEVGWDDTKQFPGPADQFIFDCGSGVSANYAAAGVGYGRMDKIFLNHLHGDHMSDLSHIYCFGPSGDRVSPLYVWGPGPSGVESPSGSRRYYDDGTRAFCANLREAMRWHSESFSFQQTSYASYKYPTRESWGLPVDPVPVGYDDLPNDGYALIPIELDWTKYGKEYEDNVAYKNPITGVKVTHFPVIHNRKGSIGYKLEWNGLAMIYTSDTKPETHCIDQAINKGQGIDVFIHEMVVPPEVWAMKNMGLDQPGSGTDWDLYVQRMTKVQNSSHTPQGAFGYILSQIQPRPRLTVATHFPVADDTVECALTSVRKYCPDIRWDKDNGDMTWSFDLMVIRVFAGDPKPTILQQRAVVNNFGYSPVVRVPKDLNDPKYADSTDQLDLSTEINAGTDTFCEDGY